MPIQSDYDVISGAGGDIATGVMKGLGHQEQKVKEQREREEKRIAEQRDMDYKYFNIGMEHLKIGLQSKDPKVRKEGVMIYNDMINSGVPKRLLGMDLQLKTDADFTPQEIMQIGTVEEIRKGNTDTYQKIITDPNIPEQTKTFVHELFKREEDARAKAGEKKKYEPITFEEVEKVEEMKRKMEAKYRQNETAEEAAEKAAKIEEAKQKAKAKADDTTSIRNYEYSIDNTVRKHLQGLGRSEGEINAILKSKPHRNNYITQWNKINPNNKIEIKSYNDWRLENSYSFGNSILNALGRTQSQTGVTQRFVADEKGNIVLK